MIFDIFGIEEKINYSFKDKTLLRKCFTHSSYGNEHGEEDNELLEFFGDAIIEFVITEHLYKNAYGDEGKLTVKRAKLVSKDPLLRAVKKLNIAQYMLLGCGQQKIKTQDEKLFSSLYEALVAGIYLDGGLKCAIKFIKNTLIKDFEKDILTKENDKIKAESKNAYQEYVQKNRMGSVSYLTLNKSGPDHSPQFRVAALLNGKKIAEGKGPSKKTAEAVAAANALQKLIDEDGRKN